MTRFAPDLCPVRPRSVSGSTQNEVGWIPLHPVGPTGLCVQLKVDVQGGVESLAGEDLVDVGAGADNGDDVMVDGRDRFDPERIGV